MRSDRIRIFDMPWDGNRANLEMVAGSDDLLSFLDTEGKQSVSSVKNFQSAIKGFKG